MRSFFACELTRLLPRMQRRCDPMPTPVVLLHPRRPSALWRALRALGPCHYVAGSPSDGAALGAARASHARALAYLAHSSRPSRVRGHTLVLLRCHGLASCLILGDVVCHGYFVVAAAPYSGTSAQLDCCMKLGCLCLQCKDPR
jgi:hypothetical protein